MIPGRMLHRLASALIPPATREHVVDAQLADFQHEWTVARHDRSRVVMLVQGYFAFWCAFAWCLFGELRMQRDDLSEVSRMVGYSVAFGAATLALLVWWPLRQIHLMESATPEEAAAFNGMWWLELVNLVPPTLAFAMPAGLIMGLASRSITRIPRARNWTVLIAVGCAVATFLTLTLLRGAVTAAYVDAIVRNQALQRVSLLMRIANARQIESMWQHGLISRAANWRFVYHLRWSLPAGTVVLAFVPLTVANRPMLTRMAVCGMACVGYYLLLIAGEEYVRALSMSPFAGAWLPNVVCVSLLIAKTWATGRSRSRAVARP
jgi:hypothetical protein